MDTELSRKLKTLMLKCGYSLDDVKKELDERDYEVDKSTISRWMSGSRKPNIEAIEQLATVLNVNKSTLYRAAGYPETQEEETGSPIGNKIIDQAIAQSTVKHWQDLADIAGLFAVTKFDDFGNLLDPGELQEQFDSASEVAVERFGRTMVECFEAHIKAEVKEGEDFWADPYRAADVLQLLAHRKTFKGKCPTCPDL